MAKFVNILGAIKGKISAKINRAFGLRGKAPKPASKARVVGHRGIAARDLRPGMQDLSAENVAQWQTLSGDVVEDFVENEQILFTHSSNVASAQYFGTVQKMMVEFHNGGSYLYSNVTSEEALEFAKAMSKGGFIWDAFRVRGSKTAHKKPYIKLKGGK